MSSYDCELTARPPEIRQVLEFKKNNTVKICYPEPPVYSIEADWHEALDIQAFTPLWSHSDNDCLANKRVGISISDILVEGFVDHHIHVDHLVRLAQDLARHLLARSATLLYGGDLRPGGFTEFILDEAIILKDRLREIEPHVENHLAWPLYVSDQKMTSWRARYHHIIKSVEYEIPKDVADDIDKRTFLQPNTTQNSYIWSRCLTKMREGFISSSTAIICAGGKLNRYKGKMPGILEEILLALDAQKPIFLLGAFGGVVGDVCKLLQSNDVLESLTEKWQINYNEGYADLQELANYHGHKCDYGRITDSIRKYSIDKLASRCGLDKNEYKRLMVSPFIDECIYLILKGFKGD